MANTPTFAHENANLESLESSHTAIALYAPQSDDKRSALRKNIVEACNKRLAGESANMRAKRAGQLARYFDCERDGATITECNISDDFADAFFALGLDDCAIIFDKSRRSTQMCNIYAIEKISKLLRAQLTGIVETMSDYCEVTLRNLRFNRMLIESKKLHYGQAHMRKSFDNINRDGVARSAVKYFKQNLCGESTSGTQASSTMRALEALGVAKVERNAFVQVDFDHALFALIARK